MDEFKDQPIEKFTEYARRSLLDLLEASYGHTESWPLIRRRVLQVFGSSGFGRYRSTQTMEMPNESQRNQKYSDR